VLRLFSWHTHTAHGLLSSWAHGISIDKLTTKPKNSWPKRRPQAAEAGTRNHARHFSPPALHGKSGGIHKTDLLDNLKSTRALQIVDRQRYSEKTASRARRVDNRGSSSNWQRCFQASTKAAKSLNDEYVSTEHLLLGLGPD